MQTLLTLLQTGRKYFNHRRIISGGDVQEIIATLQQANPKKTTARELTTGSPEIILCFRSRFTVRKHGEKICMMMK